jgi:hypothetical protein
MEFMSRGRGGQPAASGHTPHPAPQHQPKQGLVSRLARAEMFVVIVGAALLIALVALYAGSSSPLNGEYKKVKQDKYQAVFLNGGVTSGTVTYSTYFGHIKAINGNYVTLDSVYYLTDSQDQNGQSNPQLTKLGCQQLHSPYDEMVINRTQVAFWENLQDSGKVVQAIKQFQQQNPNGPNCSATSSSNSSTTPAQSTAPTTTTPQTTTTTPPTKK